MKKLGLIFCLFSILYVSAQVDASIDRRKGRWVVGGGFGIGFNSGFNIQANPDIGYRTMKTEFGLSLGLTYANFHSQYYENYKYTLWNAGPYLIYMPVRNFFVRGQYQFYSGGVKYENPILDDSKYQENALWLGGGYQDIVARHVYYRIGLMYNVLYDENTSIFSSGFLPTFGVSVGL